MALIIAASMVAEANPKAHWYGGGWGGGYGGYGGYGGGSHGYGGSYGGRKLWRIRHLFS